MLKQTNRPTNRRPNRPPPRAPTDCCDGSDELEGCKNTCIEKNAAVRETLKQKVEDYKKALDKRREYASGAAGSRKTMRARLGGIDGDIAEAGAAVEKAAGEGRRRGGLAI